MRDYYHTAETSILPIDPSSGLTLHLGREGLDFCPELKLRYFRVLEGPSRFRTAFTRIPPPISPNLRRGTPSLGVSFRTAQGR